VVGGADNTGRRHACQEADEGSHQIEGQEEEATEEASRPRYHQHQVSEHMAFLN